MDLPELVILDVGHGNCALLKDTNGTVIIDCPSEATLLETLEELSIKEISHVLISHADEDHIAGIVNLLFNEELKIHAVHLNSDLNRDTKIWKDVLSALGDARKRYSMKVSAELTTAMTGEFDVGQVKIEVLAPVPELALSGGAGAKDLNGRKLNSNSMSAVIGLVHDSHRVAMLAGDIDQVGLNNIQQEIDDLSADILVFPHHGGRPGRADSQAFAQQLCNLVKPKLVIFSLGRGRKNPREEIVEGVVSSVRDVHILCTQLSENCASILPDLSPNHLMDLPAKGHISNSCCGGTVSIKIDGSRTTYAAEIALHKEFIDAQVSTPICRKFLSRAEQV
ncbi:MAG: MBL fold metallo-hydrolase [Aphanothece sp. CMT-3BRIN-NPC111]|jgi:competence protein ComEC|nr:MBL fold metallo-hydrolase [Aphanothece sp. CMT-3BRIN-NPC111]